ncbi:hypothetical protein HELRODRAFT_182200 [Helobdella robusta]|uniref:Uncharacterized protein n=1 Tax=Helobdella robusta TaxID=6412 RepID=T1FHX1_HELRO|nr:hypothetical protein HELRODRAFT_182200 [Helobdella robusta]ESN91125.1 hypothetical protein HELRODRAFT_182200 [Helobdella robusta]
MHLSQSTLRKLNKKKALALNANKIKKRLRRLPMAKETKRKKTWSDPKRNNAGFKCNDLVWLYNLRRRKRQCPAKLSRNWKNRYKRYSAKFSKNWKGRYKITNKINSVIYRTYDPGKKWTMMEVVQLNGSSLSTEIKK